MPAGLDGENPSRTSHNYSAVGRLRDGVTPAQANRDISAIARRIHDASSEKGDYLLADGKVQPLQDAITGNARGALLILLGAVGFLLLVACANVANLLLAQASVRDRELAIRSALGAARGRLVRQFLAEAFLLCLAGGALGVLGARGGVAALVALAPPSLPRLESVSISVPVLAVRVPPLDRGRRRARRVHRPARDVRGPAAGARGRRARTGGLAGEPARGPRHRGRADRDHARARRRGGIARAEPDEGARGEPRFPRGPDRHDGRLAAVGGGTAGPGRAGDLLFPPDRPARADPGRAEGRRDERAAARRRASRRDVRAGDPGRDPGDDGRARRAVPAERAPRRRGFLRRDRRLLPGARHSRSSGAAASTSATAPTPRTSPSSPSRSRASGGPIRTPSAARSSSGTWTATCAC